MTDDFERQIAAAIDSGFERIAGELDEIASRYDLDSKEITAVVADTDWGFLYYFKDWIEGTWEKKVGGAA
jgi:hypothetical protein